jgi:hypothetical protein
MYDTFYEFVISILEVAIMHNFHEGIYARSLHNKAMLNMAGWFDHRVGWYLVILLARLSKAFTENICHP